MVTRLEARGVAYDHPGPLRAVDGVDLDLASGELLLLLGPNGSGKTTLLKCLGGVLRPTEGEVRLDGRAVWALAPRERARRIARVPQELPSVYEVTVEDFVRGGRYAHLGPWAHAGERDRAAVAEALSEADAAELGGRLLSELSGGQRQRVLVARALAQEADVLLFDEPTASLDPEHQVRTFELIRALVGRGRAAAVVTHELALVSQFASRVALLAGGRVAAAGTPEEVLRREVLEPVYGRHLLYARARVGRREAPLVVPWLDGGGEPGGRGFAGPGGLG